MLAQVERTADTVSANSYDQMPYTSLSYHESHPDRLATLATLFGVRPTPLDGCRVLELGCASGGNLIPMAYGLPGGTFVGIDYSAHQIAIGRETIEALGLTNVALEPLNILDVGPEWGQFDYIIAHGVYSWVPPDVQAKVLEICQQHLAPNGVAYVSYNTYPGWHMLNIARDMMLYHTRQVSEPQERAAGARAWIDFVSASVPNGQRAYGAFLKAYSSFLNGQHEELKGRDDSFVLHDELEEVNDPLYFYQFVERAAGHGLQYLADAHYPKMQPHDFPQAGKKLGQWAKDRIDFEQRLDFLRNQTFRQTLLCGAEVPLRRKLKPEQMSSFYVAARARPASPAPDIRPAAVVKFLNPDGSTVSTDHPVSKAALLYLDGIWPRSLPFDALLSIARTRLGLDTTQEGLALDRQALATTLLTAYSHSNSLVELHVHAPTFTLEISERPTASPVARLQARDQPRVTNLRHERVKLDLFGRYLLSHLDGHHDRRALLKCFLDGPVAEGALVLEQDGRPVQETQKIEALLAEELEENLRWLARAALLVD